MQEQHHLVGEPEIARFASVVARWRDAWARMFIEQFVRTEAFLAIAAAEFRHRVWVMNAPPVFPGGCGFAERFLARDAVEAFGYKQIDMRLHLLVRLRAPSLVEIHAAMLAGTCRLTDTLRRVCPDRRVHPFVAHMISEKCFFTKKSHFATGAIQGPVGGRSGSVADRA